MKLHEIVKDLKVGQYISRKEWESMSHDRIGDFLQLESNKEFTIWPQLNGWKHVYWNPKIEDILADDWFVIEERS